MSTPSFSGTGDAQRIDPGQTAAAGATFDADVERATRHGLHVWIAIPTHRLSDRQAAMMAGADNDPEALPLLDSESLVGVYVGCFICEEPLDRRLLERRCRGEQSGPRR